jgi:hypothetical protein
LPIYNDGKGVYERVALTPLAVTADTAIVASIAGVLWGCELAGRNSGTEAPMDFNFGEW